VVSIGIDLERIARFQLIQRPAGGACYRKIYTPTERAACRSDPLLLALCFSAKEAVAKALKTGLGLGQAGCVSPQDIEVTWRQGATRPRITITGEAVEVARRHETERILLCWHHTERSVCALAAITRTTTERSSLRRALRDSLTLIAARLDELDASTT
jgi:phosphopantetheine--protein transferase-like protein